MFGTGSRLFIAFGVLGLLVAGAYGVASGGDVLGVMSLGWKGGVGEHFGYAVLTAFGVATLVAGVVQVVIRDADPALVPAGVEAALPEVPAPSTLNFWPAVAAVGAVITVLGLVNGPLFFVVGLVILSVTAIEWTVTNWADRATGDPEVNHAIRNRVMAPIEVPVAAALVIGFIVVAISRVFLAVSATTAVTVAIVVSTLIMLAAIVIWRRPENSRRLVTVVLVIAAIALVAGGIAGVASGSREFHHEEPAAEGGEH